jgi:hypothetical protein
VDTPTLDRALADALVAIAGAMQVVLTQSDISAAHEYDLRIATRHALNAVLPGRAVAEASVDPDLFHSTVDVGVRGSNANGRPAWMMLVELKWWYDPKNQIDDAILDLAKLAAYRQRNRTTGAYLIAAGDSDAWSATTTFHAYTRLWQDGRYNLEDLARERGQWMLRQLEKLGPVDEVLPRFVSTSAVATSRST